ncbi:uncharacterized protein LOC130931834 isoform X1 [Corythoichthys intestinalis]|uniref:uncharacterized protein LOC130931834 isoform X1 n=1 Tax=Corythoichthys intestinalis TaxID=161448 RepID=UPI0025A4E332|nr:uncharacterized protein LOC130931834 isoform X1 [Corythoichthys intestinalis]
MNTEGDASLLFGAMASAAALASGVLLALLCLRCRKHRPPVSIREATESDEYIDSARFWLVHRHQPTPRITADLTMSPFVSALAGSSQRSRISQREPAESDSNHSYQNSHDEAEVPDSCSRDYLIVLPQDESSARHPSGASTPSSGRPHDYENVESYCAPTDDRDYLNVISPPELGKFIKGGRVTSWSHPSGTHTCQVVQVSTDFSMCTPYVSKSVRFSCVVFFLRSDFITVSATRQCALLCVTLVE